MHPTTNLNAGTSAYSHRPPCGCERCCTAAIERLRLLFGPTTDEIIAELDERRRVVVFDQWLQLWQAMRAILEVLVVVTERRADLDVELFLLHALEVLGCLRLVRAALDNDQVKAIALLPVVHTLSDHRQALEAQVYGRTPGGLEYLRRRTPLPGLASVAEMVDKLRALSVGA